MKIERLNEDTLYEGPISWIKNKLDPLSRARASERKSVEGIGKNHRKILAADFSKDAATHKFYMNGSKKPLTQDQWKQLFLNVEPDDIERKKIDGKNPDAQLWWNSVVTSKGGYIIRRGIEVLNNKNVLIELGGNDKIKDGYRWEDVVEIPTAAAEETGEPTEEAPAEEVNSDITEEMLKKFIGNVKALGLKLIAYDDESGDKKEVDNPDNITLDMLSRLYLPDGKTQLTDFLKNNKKLYEKMNLTEKLWEGKIDSAIAHQFRNLLHEDDTDYSALKSIMCDIYDNIHTLIPYQFDEYERDNAKEELDYLSTEADDYTDEEELEDEWNNALSDLYDICDDYNIWIPLEFEESVETTEEILTEETAWDKLVKAYPELEEKVEPLTLNEDEDGEEDEEENLIDTLYHDASEEELRDMGAFDNLNDEEDENKTLTEAPIVKLNDDDIMNPDKVDFKQKIADGIAEEEAEKAEADRQAKIAELRTKYEPVITQFEEARGKGEVYDALEVLHSNLVPGQGTADTVGGEIARAMMRLLYRDSNDGDMYMYGYGIETCASSISYLCEKVPGVEEIVEQVFKNNCEEYVNPYESDNSARGEAYTQHLNEINEKVISYLASNIDVMFTPNDEDSRDWSTDYIEENQPRYEYEIGCSDDVVLLVENRIVDSWELKSYVEEQLSWNSVFADAEVSRPFSHYDTTVNVENLTYDGYKEMENQFSSKYYKNGDPVDDYWTDFVAEHSDDLEEIKNGEEDYDEFDDDEEYDSDDDLGEAFSKNFPIEECGEKGCEEPLDESYEENFTTYEDTLQSMTDNDSEEVIDAHLRMLDKIIKTLKTTKDDLTIYIDTEGFYNPSYVDSSAKTLNKILTEFDICDGIMTLIARKSGRGDVVLYFKNKSDAKQYLRFVDKENGIV